MMSCIFRYLFGVFFIFSLSSQTVCAASVKAAHVQLELITEVSSIQPGQPFWVGVHLDMDDQWQVYWKNPGDSGLPTVIQWELPQGFEAAEVQWPFPMRMDYPELTSYGYDGEVILLSELTPSLNLVEGNVTIKASVKWLSCGNICVPGKVELSLDLPVRNWEPSVSDSVAKMFQETKRNWPLKVSNWNVIAYDDGNSLRLHLPLPEDPLLRLTQVEFFPESDELIDHKAFQVFSQGEDGYELILQKSNVNDERTLQLKGVLVSKEGWQEGRRALEINVPVNHREKEQ